MEPLEKKTNKWVVNNVVINIEFHNNESLADDMKSFIKNNSV